MAQPSTPRLDLIASAPANNATTNRKSGSGGGKTSGDCRVQVAVRVRPFINKELVDCESSCVKTREKGVRIGLDRDFDFDKVLEQTDSQEVVYQTCMRELLEKSFEGYNATVLAYGQTGSGKTFTMGTSNLSNGNGMECEEMGIIPRVIREIFSVKSAKESTVEMVLKISFFEIYNDNIIDLLDLNTVAAAATGQLRKGNSAKSAAANVFIREEVDGSINLYGITESKVNSAEEMLAALERGGMCRSTSATLMNQTSSRSHAVFTIFLEQHSIEGLHGTAESKEMVAEEEGGEVGGGNEFKTSKLHFVDLAGSERLKKTGAVGTTMREGININMGLLALGNVISALTESSNISKKHIPYRDSKLTRILQDSLGGNSNTLMIACVSPAESNFEESLNTLKYASRARRIKNKPVVNRDPQSALVSSLKQSLQEAGLENARLHALLKANGIHDTGAKPAAVSAGGGGRKPQDVLMVKNNGKTVNSSASPPSVLQMGIIEGNDEQQEEIKQLRLAQMRLEKRLKEVQAENSQLKSMTYTTEIEQLKIKRERDDLRLKLERLFALTTKDKGDNDMEVEEQQQQQQQLESIDSITPDPIAKSLVEEYSENVQKLKKDLQKKEVEFKELQGEFEEGIKGSMRDQRLLIEKEKKIAVLTRQLKDKANAIEAAVAKNTKMVQELSQVKASGTAAMNQEGDETNSSDSSESEEEEDEEEMDADDLEKMTSDPEFREMESQLKQQENQKQQTLSSVDGSITAKSEKMRQLNSQQLVLQQQLLVKMKEQYHEKMKNLENDMKRIEMQRDSALTKLQGGAEKQKVIDQFKVKVAEMQGQMADFKRKAREQETLHRTVSAQEKHITQLGMEITKFKQVKASLFKEMKKHQEEFEKFQQKKCQDIRAEKRKGIEKEKVIFRLKNQTKRQERILQKRQDDIKALVRSKDLIKRIMAQKSSTAGGVSQRITRKKKKKGGLLDAHPSQVKENIGGAVAIQSTTTAFVSDIEEVIDSCLSRMIESIEITMQINRGEIELQTILSELEEAQNKSIEFKLEIEKAEWKMEETIDKQSAEEGMITARMELEEIQSRLESIEAKYEFKKNKLKELSKDSRTTTAFAKLQDKLLTSEQFNTLPTMKLIAKSLIERFGASSAELLRTQERIEQLEVEVADTQQFCRILQSQKDICVLQMTSQINALQNKLRISTQAQMVLVGKLQAAGIYDYSDNEDEDGGGGVANNSRRFNKNKSSQGSSGNSPPKNKYRSMRLAHQMEQSPFKNNQQMQQQNITKIDDLVKTQAKSISDLTKQLKQSEIRLKTLQMRNETLQQKYDDIKRTTCKDKFIGILKQNNDEDAIYLPISTTTVPPNGAAAASSPANFTASFDKLTTSSSTIILPQSAGPLPIVQAAATSQSAAKSTSSREAMINASGIASLKDRREAKGRHHTVTQQSTGSISTTNTEQVQPSESVEERSLLQQYAVLDRITNVDLLQINNSNNKEKSLSLAHQRTPRSLQEARLLQRTQANSDPRSVYFAHIPAKKATTTRSDSMTIEDNCTIDEQLNNSHNNLDSPSRVPANVMLMAATAHGFSPSVSSENIDEEQHYHNHNHNLTEEQYPSSVAASVPLVLQSTRSSMEVDDYNHQGVVVQQSGMVLACKYECVSRINDAHAGQVYCVKAHENFLFSTSVKTLKIWDLENTRCISEIQAHGSFVRGLAIIESERWIATACDKYINLWDVVSMQKITTLTGHNVDIKHLHVENNILYSAGKSSGSNSGALVTWDIRKQTIIEEREKNQDIFAVLPYEKVIYYASRDHSVRRINIEANSPAIEPFRPPHYDVVTSLAVMHSGYLVSGSKDKYVKLWHTNPLYSFKQQSYHSTDQILTLETNADKNLLYAGQKDGKIKVLTTQNGKFKDVADINNGLYSVNSIARIDAVSGNAFACGSADKVIRIWKPSAEYNAHIHQLKNNEQTTLPANNHMQIEGSIDQDS